MILVSQSGNISVPMDMAMLIRHGSEIYAKMAGDPRSNILMGTYNTDEIAKEVFTGVLDNLRSRTTVAEMPDEKGHGLWF